MVTRPIGVSSKKPMGGRPRSVRVALTTRLVGVAIRVIRPLISAATDSGIISRVRLKPVRSTRPRTTGMKMATMPVELMKAPIEATTSISSAISRVSLPWPTLASQVPSASATPVVTRPWPTMNSPPIISTEESLKPATASRAVTTPDTASASSTLRPTASTRTLLLAKATMAAARMASTIQPSGVIRPRPSLASCSCPPPKRSTPGRQALMPPRGAPIFQAQAAAGAGRRTPRDQGRFSALLAGSSYRGERTCR